MDTKKAKQLPSDLNAEAAVLSAMMIDNRVVAQVIEGLNEEDFYRNAHKFIFSSMINLFESSIEIDIITLINNLKQKNLLEKVGGESFINDLSDVVLSAANVAYHIRIVKDKSLLRQLILTSNNIIKNCYDADHPAEDIVDTAEQQIFKIAERQGNKTFVAIQKIIVNTLDNIEAIATSKKNVIGVPTGFTDLDRQLGGFRPGQLIILASRPAMGKSSLALNFALNTAWLHDKKVGIFTMEMESEECLMRMLSSATHKLGSDKAVSMDNMLKGYGMTEKKILTLTELASSLGKKSIFIDDSGGNTILDIRAKTRRLKAELRGLDLLIIDYMQLMSSRRAKENRQQEISEISRSMKILAKEVGIPIIALSQLNRGLENRDNKRPKLSDLRESGAIEQDADIVMFIYRDEVYNQDSEEQGVAEIIVGKNRHGPVGTVKLRFFNETTTFDNYAPYEA